MNQYLNKYFLGDGKMIRHVDSYYHCPNACGHKYKYSQGLYTHRKYECGVIPRFQCSTCKKTFKQPISFRLHMKNVHKMLSFELTE